MTARPDSNRRIKVLQTHPLPLGYRALVELEDLAECCNDAVAPGLCHECFVRVGPQLRVEAEISVPSYPFVLLCSVVHGLGQ
jgi:hypothetical protein